MQTAVPTLAPEDIAFFNLLNQISQKAEITISGKPLEKTLEEKQYNNVAVDVANHQMLDKQRINKSSAQLEEVSITPATPSFNLSA